MAEDVIEPVATSISLFNSPMETGVRATVVLDAVYPRAFDLARITWLDHLVVYSEHRWPSAFTPTFLNR